jgi:hypothetical protein
MLSKQKWICLFVASLTIPAFAGNWGLKLAWVPTQSLILPGSNSGGFSPLGAGVGIDYALGKRFGLGTGIEYQTLLLGGRARGHAIVPVGVWVYAGSRLGFFAGGYLGYQVNALLSGQNALDYGLRGGAKVNIPAGKAFQFFLEAGVQYGLANRQSGTVRLTQNAIYGQVGLCFGGDRK